MTLAYEVIGQRLKAAREQLALTQTQVGDFLKVKKEIISYYETGSKPIDTWTLSKLAYLYGYSVSYFLGAEDTEAPIVTAAFRVYDLSPEDLNTIAWVEKFISNLNQINKMLGE